MITKQRRSTTVTTTILCIVLVFLCELSSSLLPIFEIKGEVVWSPCPLYSKSQTSSPTMNTIPMAECSLVQVPLDYKNNSTSNTIPVFVKRLRQSRTAKNSLWLVSGATSDFFEPVMDQLSQQLYDFDIYTLDHRGSGSSHRLNCFATQSETTGSDQGVFVSNGELGQCAAEFKSAFGDLTDQFSPTAAASDLASLIQMTNRKYNYDAFIYGFGYGTLWITRLLQLSNENNWNQEMQLYKAIVMDSVMSTSSGSSNPDLSQRWQASDMDRNVNRVGKRMLSKLCPLDETCRTKLGTDPMQFLSDTIQSLYMNRTCTAITAHLSEQNLKLMFGAMMAKTHTAELIPALVYRLNRCNVDLDIPTIRYFIEQFSTEQVGCSGCAPAMSPLFEENIRYSELWARNLSLVSYEILSAEFNQSYMGVGVFQSAKRLEESKFPRYSPDPRYFNKVGKPNVPTLLLNGEMDVFTTVESARSQTVNMGVQNTRLIEIPYATHGSTFSTQLLTQRNLTCGMEMIISFLKSRDLSIVDTRCLQNLTISFSGRPLTNLYYFGVSDVFDKAYEPKEKVSTVNLFILIGVEGATLVIALAIILSLARYGMQLQKAHTLKIQQD